MVLKLCLAETQLGEMQIPGPRPEIQVRLLWVMLGDLGDLNFCTNSERDLHAGSSWATVSHTSTQAI